MLIKKLQQSVDSIREIDNDWLTILEGIEDPDEKDEEEKKYTSASNDYMGVTAKTKPFGPGTPNQKRGCLFCDGQHSSGKCRKVASLGARRTFFYKQKLCFACRTNITAKKIEGIR